MLAKLTLRQKICQILMLDFRYWGSDQEGNLIPMTKLPTEIQQLLWDYPLGGIAFFRENMLNERQILQLVDDLQNASRIPLLLGIDQEGGVVTRIPGATDMPGNMVLGAINDPAITKQAAKVIGDELSALKINLNFAPTIDVNSEQMNPVIGVRSFGSSPEMVAKHGVAYIQGLRSAGVVNCVKHFPGHGNTKTDTHHALAYNSAALNIIEEIDLFPFVQAIQAGCDTVMMAHVVVPQLDNNMITGNHGAMPTPACLSHQITTRLLRERLGFDGVVMTDALDMKAISDNFTPAQATILAILAGNDLAVMPLRVWGKQDIEKLAELVTTLEAEYCNNCSFAMAVDNAIQRLLRLKNKFKLDGRASIAFDSAITNAQKIVGSVAHRELEQSISRQGITLIKNEHKVLPISLAQSPRLLIVSDNLLRAEIAKGICKQFAVDNQIFIGDVDTSELPPELIGMINSCDYVLLLSYNLVANDNIFEKIAAYAKSRAILSILIATRNPYDLTVVPSVSAGLCAYGCSGFDQTNYRITKLSINLENALLALFIPRDGDRPKVVPGGKLPVAIYRGDELLYPQGFGLTYL